MSDTHTSWSLDGVVLVELELAELPASPVFTNEHPTSPEMSFEPAEHDNDLMLYDYITIPSDTDDDNTHYLADESEMELDIEEYIPSRTPLTEYDLLRSSPLLIKDEPATIHAPTPTPISHSVLSLTETDLSEWNSDAERETPATTAPSTIDSILSEINSKLFDYVEGEDDFAYFPYADEYWILYFLIFTFIS